MQSCMLVKNNCLFPVSVLIDGVPVFTDILPGDTTCCKKVITGSFQITVLNNRNKVIFDLWLSAAPNTKHTLAINDSFFCFI